MGVGPAEDRLQLQARQKGGLLLLLLYDEVLLLLLLLVLLLLHYKVGDGIIANRL